MQKASKKSFWDRPCTIVMGYGIIAIQGNAMTLGRNGCYETAAKADVLMRNWKDIWKGEYVDQNIQTRLLRHWSSFLWQNVQSILKLGRAKGVAAAAIQGRACCSWILPKIKQSITGNGNAGRKQVMKMLQHLLRFDPGAAYMDASDAVAVVQCVITFNRAVYRLPKANRQNHTVRLENICYPQPGKVK